MVVVVVPPVAHGCLQPKDALAPLLYRAIVNVLHHHHNVRHNKIPGGIGAESGIISFRLQDGKVSLRLRREGWTEALARAGCTQCVATSEMCSLETGCIPAAQLLLCGSQWPSKQAYTAVCISSCAREARKQRDSHGRVGGGGQLLALQQAPQKVECITLQQQRSKGTPGGAGIGTRGSCKRCGANLTPLPLMGCRGTSSSEHRHMPASVQAALCVHASNAAVCKQQCIAAQLRTSSHCAKNQGLSTSALLRT